MVIETRPSRLIFRIFLYFIIKSLFCIRKTLRYRNKLKIDRPGIIAVFHGEMLPVLDFMQCSDSVFLASYNHLGFALSHVLISWGYKIIYGSQRHGGRQALANLAQEIKNGKNVIITPDGSRGPRHKMKAGAVVLAKRTNVPLYLVSPHYRGIRLRFSWDHFLIPLPFSQVDFRCHQMNIQPDLTREQIAQKIKEAEALLQRIANRE